MWPFSVPSGSSALVGNLCPIRRGCAKFTRIAPDDCAAPLFTNQELTEFSICPAPESSLARHSDRLRLSTQSSNEEKISRKSSATGNAQSNIAGFDLFDFGR
jgi:hypothetical protein